MTIEVEINQNNINMYLQKTNSKVISYYTELILKNSNKHVRKQSGMLEKSGKLYSKINDGLIEYNTPYAEDVYFYGTPSTNVNPLAEIQWVEYAIGKYKDNMINELQLLIEKGKFE